MLQNRLRRGEIVHKGTSDAGEHQPIVEAALWDEVQARLAANRVERRSGASAAEEMTESGTVPDPGAQFDLEG